MEYRISAQAVLIYARTHAAQLGTVSHLAVAPFEITVGPNAIERRTIALVRECSVHVQADPHLLERSPIMRLTSVESSGVSS